MTELDPDDRDLDGSCIVDSSDKVSYHVSFAKSLADRQDITHLTTESTSVKSVDDHREQRVSRHASIDVSLAPSVQTCAATVAQASPLTQLADECGHSLRCLVTQLEKDLLVEHAKFVCKAEKTFLDKAVSIGSTESPPAPPIFNKQQTGCSSVPISLPRRLGQQGSRFSESSWLHCNTRHSHTPKRNSGFSIGGTMNVNPLQFTPYNATVQMLNALPTHLLYGMEETVTEPDPTIGLLNFFANTSWDFIFKALMNVATITNVIVLGFQTGSDWIGWLYVDMVYACIFSLELAVLLRKLGWWGMLTVPDKEWRAFDTLLVLLSFMSIACEILKDTMPKLGFDFQLLRMFRILRIVRLLRLLRLDFFRDLLMMISGALGGLRTLGWSILLITIPVYGFALLLTETVGQSTGSVGGGEYDVSAEFQTMSKSMLTSFRCLVIADCSNKQGKPIFPLIIAKHGWVFGALYCLTFVCMTFGLFNVIVAIYVDNTLAAAKGNDMVQRHRRLMDDSLFAENMVQFIRFLWDKYHHDDERFELRKALSMTIDKLRFDRMQNEPGFHDFLERLDVPREDHIDLFEICDSDGSGTLTLDELVSGIKRLRGDPKRSDIVFIMLRVGEIMTVIQTVEKHIEKHLTQSKKQSEFIEQRLKGPAVEPSTHADFAAATLRKSLRSHAEVVARTRSTATAGENKVLLL